MIEAMAAVAGVEWDDRFATAWGDAYGVVAGAMLAGAREAHRIAA